MSLKKTAIIDTLIEIGAVKFGSFTLKSGIKSPIYLDLRLVISYPQLLMMIAEEMAAVSNDLSFDLIAGIPYTALPIATAFSLKTGKPMIYCRKEKKDYGTANRIEGIWKRDDRVLVIDDLITDGGSKFETFSRFEAEGLKICGVTVLIDREQGGKQRLADQGYQLFSIISIFEILDRMEVLDRIKPADHQRILSFLKEHN